MSGVIGMLLLCSYSHNHVPPEPERNVSMAGIRGTVRPSMIGMSQLISLLFSSGCHAKLINQCKGGY